MNKKQAKRLAVVRKNLIAAQKEVHAMRVELSPETAKAKVQRREHLNRAWRGIDSAVIHTGTILGEFV